MDQITPDQAQRVWNRVRGEEPQNSQPLARLLELEAEADRIYIYLTKNTPLRDSRMLRQLREENQSFLNALAGIHLLTTGERPRKSQPNALRGNAEGMLRLLWRQRQQSLALLESAQVPAEFAPALSQLRARMTTHCCLILELLGWLCRQ